MRVYLLYERATGRVGYVGKTVRALRVRLLQHRARAKLDQCYRDCWIRGAKYAVEIDEIEECHSQEQLRAAEVFWIGYFRAMGARLTNLTDGGEGLAGYTFSPETREKMAAAKRGRPSWKKGIKTGPQPRELVETRTRKLIGGKRTPEQCANIRAGKWPPKVLPDKYPEVWAMADGGMTQREIAKVLGVSQATAWLVLSKRGAR